MQLCFSRNPYRILGLSHRGCHYLGMFPPSYSPFHAPPYLGGGSLPTIHAESWIFKVTPSPSYDCPLQSQDRFRPPSLLYTEILLKFSNQKSKHTNCFVLVLAQLTSHIGIALYGIVLRYKLLYKCQNTGRALLGFWVFLPW